MILLKIYYNFEFHLITHLYFYNRYTNKISKLLSLDFIQMYTYYCNNDERNENSEYTYNIIGFIA